MQATIAISKKDRISAVLNALRSEHIKGDLASQIQEMIDNPFIPYAVPINSFLNNGSHAFPCSRCETRRTCDADFKFGEEEMESVEPVRVVSQQEMIIYPTSTKDNVWCFSKCKQPIDVRFMNDRGVEIYLRRRDEKMLSDLLSHKECAPFYKTAVPDLYDEAVGIDGKIKDIYVNFKALHPELENILA